MTLVMITLLLIGITATNAVNTANVSASVRILSSVVSSKENWHDAPSNRKRELIVKERDGRETVLRIRDYE